MLIRDGQNKFWIWIWKTYSPNLAGVVKTSTHLPVWEDLILQILTNIPKCFGKLIVGTEVIWIWKHKFSWLNVK